MVAVGAGWFVRRSLRPLGGLAAQTRAISPQHLDQRLALHDPAEELLPWVTQFNALMDRLQRAYTQLEAFNADVAHELRTPLATLIGETEVALSRERSPEALRETLQSNLEEMQRLSALVNDMLFLSQADRGVDRAARRTGQPGRPGRPGQRIPRGHAGRRRPDAAHRGRRHAAGGRAAGQARLVQPAGQCHPLCRRPGSTVVIAIGQAPDAQQVQVVVQNRGAVIAADHLPRLFDRFFRVDSARSSDDGQHHGLGLAIVAAIARMHAGRTLAESASGTTRVGFTLSAA